MLNKINLGNCLDLFKEITKDSIDVIITDPPFNLNKKYQKYIDNLDEIDYMEWCEAWISQCYRVLKPGGSLFIHNIPKWLIKYSCFLDPLMEFRHWVCWEAPGDPRGRSLQPAHYGLIYHTKPGGNHKFYEIRRDNERCRECNVLKKDYGGKKEAIPPFGPLLSDVWTDIYRLKHPKYRNNHPCQLPVTLIERIILMSSDVGDTILDCFMGSGTTAVAAKRLDRNFIGLELSEEYVAMGMKRVERQTIPSKLGDCYVSCFNGQIVTARHIDIQNGKEYRESWKEKWLYWPETPEQRIAINNNKMKLKPVYQQRVDDLCEKLREN